MTAAKTATAAVLALQLAANRERQDQLRTRAAELDAAISENEARRGRAVAVGGAEDARPLRAEARELEQERDDLRAALAELSHDADRLEEARQTAERDEAVKEHETALADVDRRMAEAADVLRRFLESDFLPRTRELNVAIDAERRLRSRLRGGGYQVSPVEMLWSRYAPLLPVVQDLEAFAAGKPIYRGTSNPRPVEGAASEAAPLALR